MCNELTRAPQDILKFQEKQQHLLDTVWLRKLKQGLCINYSREVGWGGRCKGGSKGKGYMYTYGCFVLRLTENSKIL